MKRRRPVIKLISLFFLLLALPVGMFLLSNAINYLSLADGVEANLTVDFARFKLKEIGGFRNFAQGGEEKGRMLDDVTALMKKLNPQYIRIDHVYDFYEVLKKDGSGNIYYDFSLLDEVINDITATNAIPFISLSYMPILISKSNEIDLPNNFNDFSNLVQATIEHISGKLGISDVYYEVWNEPDLFGQFKVYGAKNYLDLYHYAQLGAKRAKGVKKFKLGGPATTALYKNWFDGFFKAARAKSWRVDFYSWHRYSYDLEKYKDDSDNVNSWINNFPEFSNVEFLITEAGINSDIDKNYDLNLSAIHTIAMAASIETTIDKYFNFEIKDGKGPSKFWGRWGILTHESFGEITTKPRYKAFEFLNRMKGEEVYVGGSGTWVKSVASVSDEKFQVLVVNYDKNGKNVQAVPILFKSIPSKNFNYKRIDFLGKIRESKIATSEADWSTIELMEPNTASLFELSL